jgi:hypothetical protein
MVGLSVCTGSVRVTFTDNLPLGTKARGICFLNHFMSEEIGHAHVTNFWRHVA